MIETQRNQRSGARQQRLLLCLCVVTSISGLAQPKARVLDRAVASISSTSSSRQEACQAERKRNPSQTCDGMAFEGVVITLSQLEFEARVLLVAAGGVQAAFAPLDQQVLEASLRAVIDQRLALLEANELNAYPLEAGELEREIAAFRQRFDSEARFADFLAEHEAELEDLAEVLRRSLRAQRALEGKLRLRAQVSESEAKVWRTEHPELKDVPLEKVRSMLMQQRFGELVKKELADQRRSVDVRLLGPFSPKQGVR
jgi:hypothetical protein